MGESNKKSENEETPVQRIDPADEERKDTHQRGVKKRLKEQLKEFKSIRQVEEQKRKDIKKQKELYLQEIEQKKEEAKKNIDKTFEQRKAKADEYLKGIQEKIDEYKQSK